MHKNEKLILRRTRAAIDVAEARVLMLTRRDLHTSANPLVRAQLEKAREELVNLHHGMRLQMSLAKHNRRYARGSKPRKPRPWVKFTQRGERNAKR